VIVRHLEKIGQVRNCLIVVGNIVGHDITNPISDEKLHQNQRHCVGNVGARIFPDRLRKDQQEATQLACTVDKVNDDATDASFVPAVHMSSEMWILLRPEST
jgi:predicted DNA-binding protein (MmcQ/YjbR family)